MALPTDGGRDEGLRYTHRVTRRGFMTGSAQLALGMSALANVSLVSSNNRGMAFSFSNNCHDVTIANNIFVNFKSHALLFEADRQNYTTIQGNTFHNIGTEDKDANAIRISKSAGDFSIVGNSFRPGGSNRIIIGTSKIPISGFEVHANALQRNADMIDNYTNGGVNAIQS